MIGEVISTHHFLQFSLNTIFHLCYVVKKIILCTETALFSIICCFVKNALFRSGLSESNFGSKFHFTKTVT